MSAGEWSLLIGLLANAAVFLYAIYRISGGMRRISGEIHEVKVATDGMHDALVDATAKASRSQGKAEGRAEEKAENITSRKSGRRTR